MGNPFPRENRTQALDKEAMNFTILLVYKGLRKGASARPPTIWRGLILWLKIASEKKADYEKSYNFDHMD